MEFDGFEILPVGNAKISIDGGILNVSNITNSGLDGIIIYSEDIRDYIVNYGDLSSITKQNGVLKTTALQRNPLGQVTTLSECFTWYDQAKDKVSVGYNSNFLPETFHLYGKLNGEFVYDINSSGLKGGNGGPQPQIAVIAAVTLVVAIADLAVAIWGVLRTHETRTVTRTYDKNGNLVSYSVTTSKDPDPFEVEVNGQKYVVDEFGIYYDVNYPADLIGNEILNYIDIGEMITGYNLSSFEISSIKTN